MSTMLSNLDLLRRVPLFSLLTVTQAEVISGAVTKQRYKRGEVLVEQGQKSNALAILLTGRARVVSADSRGREVILATLGPGDYIGEMSIIDNEPHSATVRAEVQTDVLTLDREAFLNSLRENSSMAESVMRGLVRRLRKADKQIESLALMDVYGRVQAVLVDMAETDAEDHMVLRQKVSRQDVAKMVGASREMVSRVMKHFEEDGTLVERADGSFVLTPRSQHAD